MTPITRVIRCFYMKYWNSNLCDNVSTEKEEEKVIALENDGVVESLTQKREKGNY